MTSGGSGSDDQSSLEETNEEPDVEVKKHKKKRRRRHKRSKHSRTVARGGKGNIAKYHLLGIVSLFVCMLVLAYNLLISDSAAKGLKVVSTTSLPDVAPCHQVAHAAPKDPMQGILLVLHSVSRDDGTSFVPKRYWGEFTRLLIRIREFHGETPIAVVVDDYVESWFNGEKTEGVPSVRCAFNFDLLPLVDAIINGERDPRTAAMWAVGKTLVTESVNGSRTSFEHVLPAIGMLLTPWNHTIYLDTDVMPCGGLGSLFRLLGRFDAAMVPDPDRAGGARVPEHLNRVKNELALINLSLFIYDITKPGVRCLLEETLRTHLGSVPDVVPGHPPHADKEPFMGALWKCRQANVWLLQDEWICFQQTTCTAMATRFIHCKLVHTPELYLQPDFRPGGWRDEPALASSSAG